MHQFTLSAMAATAFAALLVSVPAQADSLNGAAAKNGSQCFNFSPTSGSRDSRWGYWGACPQTASAAVAPAPRQIRRHRSASR
jgi:hypothetical protein